MSKAANPAQQTAQAFINAEAIQDSILWTKDKHLYTFLRLKGKDNSLLTSGEHAEITKQMAVDLADQKQPFQFISVPRTADVDGMLQELKQMCSSTNDEARIKLINGEIDALEKMTQQGAREPLIFLKIWAAAAPNADRELLERAAILVDRFRNNNISAEVMNDDQILLLCKVYAELGVWQTEKVVSDIPVISGTPRLFSRRPTPDQIAEAELMEQITPCGLRFKPTGFLIGNMFCRAYGVTRYPADVDYGWAVKLMGGTDCITCITYTPGNEAEIGDALSRSIKASNRDAESESDIRTKKRFERKAKDADKLIDEQDAMGMALGYMSIVTVPFAGSEAELEEVCKNVVARFGAKQMKLRPLTNVQKDAFRHISPYYPDQPMVNDVLVRIVPLQTVVGGYPCTLNILRDDHGVYFAKTPEQNMISLDVRVRSEDRTNGNGITTGIPGTGKSTMLKHLLESMYMQGIKIIAIDPEREFRELCKNLGGSWWDAGGGHARINLLQLQASVQDTEEDDAFRSPVYPLPEHIQTVLTVLRYKIPSLTDTQISLLERVLRELYGRFGFTMEQEFDPTISNDKYPIMEDLYDLLTEKAAMDPRYDELALLLESMAIGADASIWNGHTNIDLSADIVVIDTNRLYGSSSRNRVAQYYNLMRMAFTWASADRETPYAIFADEAQTMFDPELPAAANALKNIALRIRKYEGYLWLAFHSLQELLDERVRIYGQPILDAAAYKILFGTDGQNLADTMSLFQLTPAEEKVLAARQRGKALALIGSQHLKVVFDLPAYKLKLMGRGGGR